MIRCISKQLASVNVWNENYIDVSTFLQQAIAIGDRWIGICKELTEIFWPNYSLHVWTGEPFIPESLIHLIDRLKEVFCFFILGISPK